MIITKINKDTEPKYRGLSETAVRMGIKIPSHTHHYEIFPYVYNSIVTSSGEIVSKQSYHKDGSKHKVIYNGDTTIVILDDGSKGVAKCNPEDTYDKFLGYKIAKARANIASLKKELEELTK